MRKLVSKYKRSNTDIETYDVACVTCSQACTCPVAPTHAVGQSVSLLSTASYPNLQGLVNGH